MARMSFGRMLSRGRRRRPTRVRSRRRRRPRLTAAQRRRQVGMRRLRQEARRRDSRLIRAARKLVGGRVSGSARSRLKRTRMRMWAKTFNPKRWGL